MNTRDYRLIFVFAVLLAFLGPISYAADEPCTVAYRDATKTTEFNECERAAIAGNAQAEFGYGLILFSGHDRKNDRAAGLDWLRKSARQGHRLARTTLGGFLSRLPSDDPLSNLTEAYAWFTLTGATKAASDLTTRMTPRQVDDAQKLAAEYLAKYGKSSPLGAEQLN
jgi:TPR repeat protein